MGPVFERLAEKNKQAKFCKINVDDAGKVAQDYEISSIPCIIFFKDGQEVDRITGGLSEDLFQEKISDYLKM
jgi:thioredoxin-like negative regulator of GroEL